MDDEKVSICKKVFGILDFAVSYMSYHVRHFFFRKYYEDRTREVRKAMADYLVANADRLAENINKNNELVRRLKDMRIST